MTPTSKTFSLVIISDLPFIIPVIKFIPFTTSRTLERAIMSEVRLGFYAVTGPQLRSFSLGPLEGKVYNPLSCDGLNEVYYIKYLTHGSVCCTIKIANCLLQYYVTKIRDITPREFADASTQARSKTMGRTIPCGDAALQPPPFCA